MTKTLRNRLTLLGTTGLFAAALVAAPVQFSSITPDLAVAHAAGSGGGVSDAGGTGAGGSGSGGGDTAGGSGSGSGQGADTAGNPGTP